MFYRNVKEKRQISPIPLQLQEQAEVQVVVIVVMLVLVVRVQVVVVVVVVVVVGMLVLHFHRSRSRIHRQWQCQHPQSGPHWLHLIVTEQYLNQAQTSILGLNRSVLLTVFCSLRLTCLFQNHESAQGMLIHAPRPHLNMII